MIVTWSTEQPMAFFSPHRVLHFSAEKSPSLQSSMHEYDGLMPPIILRVGFLTNYTVIVKERYLYLISRCERKERKKKGGVEGSGFYSQGAKSPCYSLV